MSALILSVAADTDDFWIAMNDQDVVIRDGRGSARPGIGDHLLIWWMAGASGSTMNICVHDGETELLRVSGAIPPGRRMDAGLARVRVTQPSGSRARDSL
jgi:hypothetical protein